MFVETFRAGLLRKAVNRTARLQCMCLVYFSCKSVTRMRYEAVHISLLEPIGRQPLSNSSGAVAVMTLDRRS